MADIPTTGSFNIIIQMPSETGSNTNKTPSPSSPQSIENEKGNPTEGDENAQAKLSTAINTAKTIGTQAVNTAIGNIGLATGNYYAQQQAQRVMSGAQTFVNLAMSLSNPLTLGVTLAGMAISASSEMYQQQRTREIANYEAEQYAKRLGYTRDRR